MTSTDDPILRYARHIVLKEVGGTGQRAFGRASVAVIGAGGIGSPAIQYLAGAGVARLILIDDDRVEPSNLHRQTIFTGDDAGRTKVEAAAARVAALNPHVAVEPRAARIDATNATTLLEGADVVLDGCDDFATRLAVSDATLALRVPLVSAAVSQFEGQLGVYRGWEAYLPCYRCLVGGDPAGEGGTCAEDGVLGPAAGVMGTLAALEVLRVVAGFGETMAGRLLLADLLSMRFRTIAVPKDPGCPACGAQTRL